MEHTASGPEPMPGQVNGQADAAGPTRRPQAESRRGRRLRTLLLGLFTGTVLVLCGVGLGTVGTVGATVTGLGRLAELRHHMTPHATATASGPAPAVPTATLGLEAVDAEKDGALVVGVHVPGPGYTAGLVRGDVLLQFGTTRVDTAADLARAVARARPGTGVTLTVLHHSGGYQQLTVVPAAVV
ncbi:PDZ domain-containing protein [Streptomyces sp. NK08204]|uniref:PDZ domain-containing protein n=1 Tax=Streptomyces sp. NK08204 TaxID=2873260 RepID=UPI001CEC3EF3|nr:PDZ domain-containing protein [Streptomyces sp. NK08204]